MKVYKYPLAIEPLQVLKIPPRRFLSLQLQNGITTLWASVLADRDPETLTIKMVGTGNGEVDLNDVYIGTVQLDGYVWHYFITKE